MRRKPHNHNNPPAQPKLAIDQVLTDLDTKLQQQYRLLQRSLTQIIDATEQGYLLIIQSPPVIRPVYNNQMLRSLRALSQSERAHPTSVDMQLTRILVFTGKLDQELKKLTAQQVVDQIWSNPEIVPLK
ncbi:MAG: hypothetical protein EZS28_002290 [Streblomastix strix]|uniref:Uncharacterized protein n=1 Tax=Streblomastix strix TaxID=222440 RepID=A0A5J4X4R3_9EUKA|nr:MAG: hypothetical protein EZS28_002290 [Streblomastix strix]